jgi:hypothetical protein
VGLGVWFAVGVALWGPPIALVGVFPREGVALGHLQALRSSRFLAVVLGFTPAAREAALGVARLLDRFVPTDPDSAPPAVP